MVSGFCPHAHAPPAPGSRADPARRPGGTSASAHRAPDGPGHPHLCRTGRQSGAAASLAPQGETECRRW
jgi:hypothetical protein